MSGIFSHISTANLCDLACLFTVLNKVAASFYTCLSFCPQGGVWQTLLGRHILLGRHPLHCSGRYASYWNAFLLVLP